MWRNTVLVHDVLQCLSCEEETCLESVLFEYCSCCCTLFSDSVLQAVALPLVS